MSRRRELARAIRKMLELVLDEPVLATVVEMLEIGIPIHLRSSFKTRRTISRGRRLVQSWWWGVVAQN